MWNGTLLIQLLVAAACHMQLLYINTNLASVNLDFTSLCPKKLNATWYNTWLQKTMSFLHMGA